MILTCFWVGIINQTFKSLGFQGESFRYLNFLLSTFFLVPIENRTFPLSYLWHNVLQTYIQFMYFNLAVEAKVIFLLLYLCLVAQWASRKLDAVQCSDFFFVLGAWTFCFTCFVLNNFFFRFNACYERVLLLVVFVQFYKKNSSKTLFCPWDNWMYHNPSHEFSVFPIWIKLLVGYAASKPKKVAQVQFGWVHMPYFTLKSSNYDEKLGIIKVPKILQFTGKSLNNEFGVAPSAV